MTRILISAAAIAAALASPVAADQLARSAGVEPGIYTRSELTILREARQNNDDLVYRTVLERGADRQAGEALSTRRTAQDATVGDAQTAAALSGHERLARSLGVDPAEHTTGELARMFIDRND